MHELGHHGNHLGGIHLLRDPRRLRGAWLSVPTLEVSKRFDFCYSGALGERGTRRRKEAAGAWFYRLNCPGNADQSLVLPPPLMPTGDERSRQALSCDSGGLPPPVAACSRLARPPVTPALPDGGRARACGRPGSCRRDRFDSSPPQWTLKSSAGRETRFISRAAAPKLTWWSFSFYH